jgi:hypothetical protein
MKCPLCGNDDVAPRPVLRNEQLVASFRKGAKKSELARYYMISPARVAQIIHQQEVKERRAFAHEQQQERFRQQASRALEACSVDDMLIEDMELSVRTRNCFRNDDIVTVGQARQLTDAELLRIPNFGRLTLAEWREALAALELQVTGMRNQAYWNKLFRLPHEPDPDGYWWD